MRAGRRTIAGAPEPKGALGAADNPEPGRRAHWREWAIGSASEKAHEAVRGRVTEGDACLRRLALGGA